MGIDFWYTRELLKIFKHLHFLPITSINALVFPSKYCMCMSFTYSSIYILWYANCANMKFIFFVESRFWIYWFLCIFKLWKKGFCSKRSWELISSVVLNFKANTFFSTAVGYKNINFYFSWYQTVPFYLHIIVLAWICQRPTLYKSLLLE